MLKNTQFTQNCKNMTHAIPCGIRRMLFFCILFLSSIVVKAQLMPVGAEFSGEWSFDRAEAQERTMNIKENYTKRTVSQDEFWQQVYFLNMPTRIAFLDGFLAQISHPSWSKFVAAVINPLNNNMLEFRDFPENPDESHIKNPDPFEMELYTVMTPAYSLTLKNNTMSLQCDYLYVKGQGKYIEGILTIYYKR